MTELPATLAAPGRRALLLEIRSAIDVARMMGPLLGAGWRRPSARDGTPVIVVPGFGSDDRYTLPLRHYLNCLGFRAEGWGMGRNLAGVDIPHTPDALSDGWQFAVGPDYRGEGSVPHLCDRLADRVLARHEQIGQAIALVGWSLGGYLAREVARDLPEVVDRVITLGSPVVGGPKYTAAAGFFRRRGMNLDWIEEEIRNRETRPIRQPITAIFSKTDGIVSWQAAIDRYSGNVNHIEVNAAHIGLGFNPTVWEHIVDALKAETD